MNRAARPLPRYRPSVFRHGLLLVLIPGILSSIFLIALNQFWMATSTVAREEQVHSNSVLDIAISFNALVTYCYDIMTLSFDRVLSLEQRTETDKKAFLISLERIDKTKKDSKKEIAFDNFRNYALMLKAHAEKLSEQMSNESFDSNINRFIRYKGLMAKGVALAESLSNFFRDETEELKELRQQLQVRRNELNLVSAFGIPAIFFASLLSLYIFARSIFLRIRALAASASAFPNLPERRRSEAVLDEFGYVDEVISEAAEDLRNASERRQAFVQMLAHDMRSPLMATQVYVDVLQEMHHVNLSEQGRQMCRSVKDNLTNVHDFVTDLLTAEKLECEPIELSLIELSLNNLVDDALGSVMEPADEKDVAIEYDGAEVFVRADREYLLQALVCFLKAVLQAAPHGSIISLLTSIHEGNVTLTFAASCDSDEEIEDLFDPLLALGNDNSFQISGCGLNLRIGRLIAEAHSGSVGGRKTSQTHRDLWLKLPLPESRAVLKTGSSSADSSSTMLGYGWRDLLSSYSFRNCALVFLAALILQSVWILWLGSRIEEARKLSVQAARQTDTVFGLNKLWLDLFLANNAMGFYLATKDQANRVLAKENLKSAEELVGSLNQLFYGRAEESGTWSDVRSFVLEELSALKSMDAQSEEEQVAADLGILGRRIERASELNALMHTLSDFELGRLNSMRLKQGNLRERFQSIILLAVFSNLLTTLGLLWLFSRTISFRLDMLVKVARQIPSRLPINQMISGKDEIYQIYWLLCRAALNLKDAFDQRKVMMNLLSANIGKPLASVQADLSRLSEILPDDISEKSRVNLKSASENIKRLLALVEDLLLLDELELGDLRIEKSLCSAHEIVDASINSVGGIALRKDITIVNECAEFEIEADRKRLIQVLVNLLGNAVKFSPRNSRIRVEGGLYDGKFRIAVADEGPGISKEDLDKVFARFYQMQEHKKQGFGLGLSICVLIVRSHGGEITAESEVGKGSKFILTLPVS